MWLDVSDMVAKFSSAPFRTLFAIWSTVTEVLRARMWGANSYLTNAANITTAIVSSEEKKRC